MTVGYDLQNFIGTMLGKYSNTRSFTYFGEGLYGGSSLGDNYNFSSLNSWVQNYSKQYFWTSIFNQSFQLIGGAVASYHQENAANDIDYQAAINQIDIDIKNGTAKKGENNTKIGKLNTEIAEADQSINNLMPSINSLETEIGKKQKDLDALKSPDGNGLKEGITQTQYDDALKELNELKNKLTTKQNELEAEKTKKKQAQAQIEALKAENAEIDKSIQELNKTKAEYEAKLKEQPFDDANGNIFNRASKSHVLEQSQDRGYSSDHPASKREFRTAVNEFVKAQKANPDSQETKDWAQILVNMYESNKTDLKSTNNDVFYESAKKYLQQ